MAHVVDKHIEYNFIKLENVYRINIHIDTRGLYVLYQHMLSTTEFSLTQTNTDVSLSVDTIYNILSNRRRRYAVHYLKYTKQTTGVKELSRQITAWEVGIDPDNVEYSDRRRVYATLKDTHLPMLEEYGLIEYDDSKNIVSPTPTLAELDVYIEIVQDREIPWSDYYIGIASISVLIMLAVGVGVPGIAAIGPLGVSMFIITAFTVSAIIHHHYSKRSRLGVNQKPPELKKQE